MDFVKIVEQRDSRSKNKIFVQPSFNSYGVKDLIVQGDSFKAYWTGKEWSMDLDQLLKEIDKMIWDKVNEVQKEYPEATVTARTLLDYSSGMYKTFLNLCKDMPNNDVSFNKVIRFANEEITRDDYATFKLDYTPMEGKHEAFDEMINTWYAPEDRDKILWSIGLILSKRTAEVQKFLFLYGGKGEGKGSVLDIMNSLFGPYVGDIELERLTGKGDFATSQVQDIPILIDSDSDMSRIRNDTNLLKLTAHEPIAVNEKYKSMRYVTPTGFLVAASNQPYKVRNQDSGITRRAIVARPTGNKIPYDRYKQLFKQLKFEIPAIAHYAIDRFEALGISYYETMEDLKMSEETDLMYAFFVEYYNVFADKEYVTLKFAKELYIQYLEELTLDTQGAVKQLKNQMQKIYFREYHKEKRIDGVKCRNVFMGFNVDRFKIKNPEIVEQASLEIDSEVSTFDAMAEKYPAQLANKDGFPMKKWDDNLTVLGDIDTTKLHYVKVPHNHIVIDFDLKDENGEKSLDLNLLAASEFPPTYAELSKSGGGIHLHYIYDGNVEALAADYAPGIEQKVFKGNAALRRKLTKCNNLEIAHISTGLKLKEEKQMLQDNEEIVWNDKKLRRTVEGNLRKEYHSSTKSSIDFINKVLTEAKAAGVEYNLEDLKPAVANFAFNSTNNRQYCMKLVKQMPFSTIVDEIEMPNDPTVKKAIYKDEEIVFYDIEVFQNLFIVCFKTLKEKHEGKPGTTWINPSQEQMEWLIEQPLGGFNSAKYDNHICYDAALGRSTMELYMQSQQIINGDKINNPGLRMPAYNLGYVDVYEYNDVRQSLKKWEIQLGLFHDELELPWDQPVPEDMWERVAEYCMHDVDATIDVFEYTYPAYKARLILSQLSGQPMIASTNRHAASFLFGNEKRPQDKFVYTDLATQFPGYKYEYGTSTYRGENPSEGGYVYSEPGVYKNAAVLDIASMHPHSLIALDYFGPYTQKYADLVQARMYVKHREFDKAGEMFGGVLKPYLVEEEADSLAHALKIIINIVYGMTSAKFDNKFRHPKNVDNIVAKRGALFMIDLKHAVQDKGFTVMHIKTDSIKIPDATPEIIEFVHEFGRKYGYEFEHEATYERVALVNKAVLVGKHSYPDDHWDVVGAMFADPYVYKTLVEPGEMEDLDFAQTKTANSPMYLGSEFIGKAGQFYASKTGKPLIKKVMKKGEEVDDAVTGTKGYLWREFEDFQGKEDVDMDFYEGLVHKAVQAIDRVGNVHEIFPDLPAVYENEVLPF